MNYQKHYNALIEKAQSRPKPDGYTERHHILPKALGGSDNKTNLIALTAREHCFAHLLLAKIHGGTMWHAIMMLTNRFQLNSKAYSKVKEQHSKHISKVLTGKKHSEATKQKMSKPKSEKAKINISLAKQGTKNPSYGKTGNLSASYKGAILATNLTTNETFVLNGNSHMNSLGFKHQSVYRCVLGQRKTYKNHTFKRINSAQAYLEKYK